LDNITLFVDAVPCCQTLDPITRIMEQGRPSDSYAAGPGAKPGAAAVPPAGKLQRRSRAPFESSVDTLLDTVVQLLARRVAHDLIMSEDAGVQE
jgi:hypothetical protein